VAFVVGDIADKSLGVSSITTAGQKETGLRLLPYSVCCRIHT